jgi:hypothetical protein
MNIESMFFSKSRHVFLHVEPLMSVLQEENVSYYIDLYGMRMASYSLIALATLE